MKRIFPFLLSGLLLLLFPQIVHADTDVVLNEFQVEPENAQWVELYNTGNESVDISGWIIDDDGSPTLKFVIPPNQIIGPGEVKVYHDDGNDFSFNVASTDEVRLLQGDTPIDSEDYEKSPGPNVTKGRITDGTGDWYTFNPGTEGLPNNTATPLPTSTPAPTATPKPTDTPSPSKTPTPTSTPIPTNTLLPTKKIIPTSVKTPTPKKVSPTVTVTRDVLGEKTEKKKPSEIPVPTPATQVKGSSGINPGVLFISIGGVLLLACGILAFYMKKKSEGAA